MFLGIDMVWVFLRDHFSIRETVRAKIMSRSRAQNIYAREHKLYLTNKEASTVLCSVVKHAGSGKARKKCRGNI